MVEVLTAIKVDEAFIEEMNKFREPDKTKGLIEACSENCVLFSERMLGIRLYAWQVYGIQLLNKICNTRDAHELAMLKKKFLFLTSRQIGKSTLMAVFSTWVVTFNKYPGTVHNHSLVGIISATDQQAKKLLYEIRKILRTGDRHMEYTYLAEDDTPLFGKKFFSNLLDDAEPNNTTTLTFKRHQEKIHGPYLLAGSRSGSVIKSFSPTSIVLGETFSILIEDEAGKSDKITDQFHDDFASPTISSTDGMNILTSTPWVTSGFFYDAADPDNRKEEHEYERYVFTCEAIKLENPKQYEVIQREIEKLNKDGKQDVVQRAYYCRFVKGETTYFDPQDILEVFTPDYAMAFSSSDTCDMGIDYGGQVKSRTVVTVTKLDSNNQMRRIFHKTYPVGQDLSLLSDVERWIKDFNVQRIIPDDCPAGDFLNRTMIEKGWNITPMNFRTDKVKKYGAFRAAMKRGEIISYEDDELQTEMLAMEFTQGDKQSLIQHAPGYSDDLIDSFIMSCYHFLQEEGGLKSYDTDMESSKDILLMKDGSRDSYAYLQAERQSKRQKPSGLNFEW